MAWHHGRGSSRGAHCGCRNRVRYWLARAHGRYDTLALRVEIQAVDSWDERCFADPAVLRMLGWRQEEGREGPTLVRGYRTCSDGGRMSLARLMPHVLVPALLIVVAHLTGQPLLAPLIFVAGVLQLWGRVHESGWRVGRGYAEMEQRLFGRVRSRRRLATGVVEVRPSVSHRSALGWSRRTWTVRLAFWDERHTLVDTSYWPLALGFARLLASHTGWPLDLCDELSLREPGG